MKTSAVLFLSGFAGIILNAQPVFHDSKAPQVSFAASEIRHAFAPNAASADRAIRDLASDTSPIRFVIAGDAAESKALAQRLLSQNRTFHRMNAVEFGSPEAVVSNRLSRLRGYCI